MSSTLRRLAGDTLKKEDGWKTVFELMDEDGSMSETLARRILNDAVRRGTVEVKKMKTMNDGKVRTMLHYREVKR